MFNIMIFTLSSLMTVISYNWLVLWILMEINIMNFSIFMMKSKKKNNSFMKYFLIQILSGVMMFYLFNYSFYSNMMSEKINSMVLFLLIIMKSGSFPFSSWAMEISNKISWIKMLILNSMQKIFPLILIWKLNMNMMMYYLIFMNSMFTSMFSKIVNSPKKIMMISSLMNFSWILFLNDYKIMMFTFLLMYSLLNFNLINSLKIHNINMNNLNLTINLLMISGLPPFSMFNLKWMSYQLNMMNQSSYLMMILVVFSIPTIMMYMNLSLFSLFLTKSFNYYSQPNNLLILLITLNFLKN